MEFLRNIRTDGPPSTFRLILGSVFIVLSFGTLTIKLANDHDMVFLDWFLLAVFLINGILNLGVGFGVRWTKMDSQ